MLLVVSTLPPASHVNTCMHRGMGWQDLVNQLKMITASNPRRAISRVTLGYKIKIGSLGTLALASGGSLMHLDLTCAKGAKNLDFEVMAKQLPNLKGLAVSRPLQLDHNKDRFTFWLIIAHDHYFFLNILWHVSVSQICALVASAPPTSSSPRFKNQN